LLSSGYDECPLALPFVRAMATILSVAPYPFLPPVNGGHWGIINVEKLLSVFNEVHTVTTDNNVFGQERYPFRVHTVLSSSKLRYLPYSQYRKVYRLAKTLQPQYLFCHHHYMFPMVAKLARKLNVPAYIRCHNIEAERFKSTGKWWWKAMQWFERSAFLRSAGVFFVTREDRDWAVAHYGLPESKALVMPFAIDRQSRPPAPAISKKELAAMLNLDAEVPWLFFMGKLDYAPNEEAVTFIVKEILPRLRQKRDRFHILICGKGLPAALQQEIAAAGRDIHYLGFVPEIEPLIAACDLMINPVISGGGVKTKVVESLAWNKTVVSAHSGAIGIEKAVCGNKLLIAPDKDWQAFTGLICAVLDHPEATIPDTYFDHYYLGNVAKRLQPHFSGNSL